MQDWFPWTVLGAEDKLACCRRSTIYQVLFPEVHEDRTVLGRVLMKFLFSLANCGTSSMAVCTLMLVYSASTSAVKKVQFLRLLGGRDLILAKKSCVFFRWGGTWFVSSDSIWHMNQSALCKEELQPETIGRVFIASGSRLLICFMVYFWAFNITRAVGRLLWWLIRRSVASWGMLRCLAILQMVELTSVYNVLVNFLMNFCALSGSWGIGTFL